jgi:ubiquitin-protein ligase
VQGYSKYANELSQLSKLQELLQQDVKLPLRIELHWQNLRKTEFTLILKGVEGLVGKPGSTRPFKSGTHTIGVLIPARYLELNRMREDAPKMSFRQPIFHPHVFASGQVCWGISAIPAGDIFLVDWVLTLIEYIQYVPERIESSSPAGEQGSQALEWWRTNRSRLSQYLALLDMDRLRLLVKRSKGLWR